MEYIKMTLIPYGLPPIELQLHKEVPSNDINPFDIEGYNTVYSDLTYTFFLTGLNVTDIADISVFINDEEKNCQMDSDGNIYFRDLRGKEDRPFQDNLGFVFITINITYPSDEVVLHTEYLSVLIQKNLVMDSVSKMIDYIYRSREILLLAEEHASKYFGGLKPNRIISLEAKIELAQRIYLLYKNQYGYYKANRRFKTISKEIVDRIEKLDVISGNTLRYIVTHPGLLRESPNGGGIQIDGNNYIPEKTLVRQNQYTVDIYENQVVVGFLDSIIHEIERMQSSIDALVRTPLSKTTSLPGQYVHSSFFIFQRAMNSLLRGKEQLKALHKQFLVLSTMYRNILPVKAIVVNHLPKPTAIMLSVPQYSSIYKMMEEWFYYGLYNLEREQLMLSFLNTSVLYEVYILTKMIESIMTMGYTLASTSNYTYPVSQFALYRNTFCNNTFEFYKEQERLTLYFQPVIFDSKKRALNGIELYRNNTYSPQNENVFSDNGVYYYTPDYLIKKTDGGKTRYAVVDAKFSTRATVRNNQVVPLAFKYLFSLTGRKQEQVSSLHVIYGQISTDNYRETVYNRIIPGSVISPSMYLAPIGEGINDEMHATYFSDIISSL